MANGGPMFPQGTTGRVVTLLHRDRRHGFQGLCVNGFKSQERPPPDFCPAMMPCQPPRSGRSATAGICIDPIKSAFVCDGVAFSRYYKLETDSELFPEDMGLPPDQQDLSYHAASCGFLVQENTGLRTDFIDWGGGDFTGDGPPNPTPLPVACNSALSCSWGAEIQFLDTEFPDEPERQRLTIAGGPTGGSFTITYNNLETDPIPFNAGAFLLRLRLVQLGAGLGSIQVSRGGIGPNFTYDIVFFGVPGDINELTVDDDNVVGGTVTVSTLNDGTTEIRQWPYIARDCRTVVPQLHNGDEVPFGFNLGFGLVERGAFAMCLSGDLADYRDTGGNLPHLWIYQGFADAPALPGQQVPLPRQGFYQLIAVVNATPFIEEPFETHTFEFEYPHTGGDPNHSVTITPVDRGLF